MASSTPPSTPAGTQADRADTGAMAWWRSLSGQGRRAFAGAFLGYALDSYDFWVLPLGLVCGTAQGFTYNVGRGIGAFFPTVIGFLATTAGVGGAMAFGAMAYGLVVLALFGLPETAAKELT